MQVELERRGSLGLIVFSHPPVNALSARAGLPQALWAAVETLLADLAIGAIVIRGDGRCFSAGADIGDFGDDPVKDLAPLRTLIEGVGAASKPVVAAIHGLAFGGGLELALACHARIAAKGTKFAFPEVTLGILPGGGGTQRLPRLVGTAAALDMMLTGAPIGVEAALSLGLIDTIADDVDAEALGKAAALAGRPLAPTGDRPLSRDGAAEALDKARAAVSRGAGSPQARQGIIDCVEAALTRPFAEGLAFEFSAFDALMLSEASLGLRHAFLGERTVAKIPNLAKDIRPRPIASAAVIGAGTMGAGIATAILNAGLPVLMIEQKPDALERGAGYVKKTIEADVAKGRIDAETAQARLALLSTSLHLADAGQADIVIEAVFEDAEVKRQVFTALDAIAKPGAILASNTSTLDLNAIAAATKRPGDVVGAHFFSPANIMKLLEIVRGDETSPQVLTTALAFAKTIGKVGVVAGVCNGFIGNRMFEEYLRQAYLLLEEGALPVQVDGALERWGMAMGPLKVMDLVGQDIGLSIRKRRAIEQPDRPYSRLPDMICEMGRFGQKTGAGYYQYPDSRTAAPDPQIDALIMEHSKALGLTRRAIPDDEIVARCVLALVNEGAKILGEGIAYRAVDIDIVYIQGYGFPRTRGGPMFYADRLGLPSVLAQVKAFAEGHEGWAWAPAPLLVDLAGRGASFASVGS
jgi:3-hydroxyacyl-CoA dehydrogenase